MPNTTDLLKKNTPYYDVNISDVDKKYFTTSDYNKFTGKILDAKIKKKRVNESNISVFINISDLDKKIETLTTKAELKAEQDVNI